MWNAMELSQTEPGMWENLRVWGEINVFECLSQSHLLSTGCPASSVTWTVRNEDTEQERRISRQQ